MDVSRNAPCPCGSGRKYKACCAVKGHDRGKTWVGAIIALGVLIGGLLAGAALLRPERGDATAGQVWSEAHGHWHDAP